MKWYTHVEGESDYVKLFGIAIFLRVWFINMQTSNIMCKVYIRHEIAPVTFLLHNWIIDVPLKGEQFFSIAVLFQS
jgi:hypothetical protein